MRRTTKVHFPLFVLALAALAACQPAAQDGAIDTAADEAAVREVAQALYSHLESGDWSAARALYREDALVIAPGAPPIDKQALFSSLDQPNPSLPPDASTRFIVDLEEVVVAGDLAYERGSYITRVVDNTSGEAVPGVPEGPRVVYAHIFKRDPGGSWKVWRYHPAPPPAPAAE